MADGKPNEGWIAYAVLLAFMAGVTNALFGFIALLFKEALPAGGIAALSTQQWGWLLIALGVVQCIAGYMISTRKNSGRIFGITLAILSILCWTVWIQGMPIAGVTVLIADVLVIYGLSVTRESFT